MTVVLDDSLFEDPDRLLAADSGDLLRTVALAGAQVRAVAETAGEVGISELAGDRPRSVVLLARPGLGTRVCQLLAALAARAPVPVLVAETLPSWVGALDAVFVHVANPGDTELAESVSVASRRGATVVLAAADEGPVAASGAGRALLLPPKFPVPPELSFGHVFAAGLSMLAAFDLLTLDTAVLADELDGESENASPAQGPAVNSAKTLALRLADRTPMLWGVDSVGTAVARYGGFGLGCHAAVPCDVADYAEAIARRALYRVAAATGSSAALFADPEQDGNPPRAFLISTRHDERAEQAELVAVQDLPGADVVSPAESVSADPVLRSAVLATRFDFAAVYLGLAAGTLDGPDPRDVHR